MEEGKDQRVGHDVFLKGGFLMMWAELKCDQGFTGPGCKRYIIDGKYFITFAKHRFLKSQRKYYLL